MFFFAPEGQRGIGYMNPCVFHAARIYIVLLRKDLYTMHEMNGVIKTMEDTADRAQSACDGSD